MSYCNILFLRQCFMTCVFIFTDLLIYVIRLLNHQNIQNVDYFKTNFWLRIWKLFKFFTGYTGFESGFKNLFPDIFYNFSPKTLKFFFKNKFYWKGKHNFYFLYNIRGEPRPIRGSYKPRHPESTYLCR